MGGDAGQGGGLAPVDVTEFGHEGDEGGGGGGADAGDGTQGLLGPHEVVGAGHQLGDGRLQRLDLPDEAGAQASR